MTGVVEGKLAAQWVAVRSLHSPVKVSMSAGMSYALGSSAPTFSATFGLECSYCRGVAIVRTWPCATARIVYGDREVAAALAGTPPEDDEVQP